MLPSIVQRIHHLANVKLPIYTITIVIVILFNLAFFKRKLIYASNSNIFWCFTENVMHHKMSNINISRITKYNNVILSATNREKKTQMRYNTNHIA